MKQNAMPASSPPENLPEIGTVASPAVLLDGDNAFVCYEASPRAGGGNVVLKFEGVIDFRVAPIGVEGLKECNYEIQPWAFNEASGEEVARWQALNPRFWLISFNDVMIEVLFETVLFVIHDREHRSQSGTLLQAVTLR